MYIKFRKIRCLIADTLGIEIHGDLNREQRRFQHFQFGGFGDSNLVENGPGKYLHSTFH